MLLTSSNAVSLTFAQSDTLEGTDPSVEEQTNTTNDNNNEDKQNFEDFITCLDENVSTSGFATEQQIRDCFTPIYIDSNDNSNDANNDNEDDNSSD
jgi:hypothetical protein